jgi:hypothetical protein
MQSVLLCINHVSLFKQKILRRSKSWEMMTSYSNWGGVKCVKRKELWDIRPMNKHLENKYPMQMLTLSSWMTWVSSRRMTLQRMDLRFLLTLERKHNMLNDTRATNSFVTYFWQTDDQTRYRWSSEAKEELLNLVVEVCIWRLELLTQREASWWDWKMLCLSLEMILALLWTEVWNKCKTFSRDSWILLLRLQ